MHKSFFLSLATTFLLFCLSITNGSAQIGINTINPDTSAALDVQGTNKGILFPRSTQLQLTNIFEPATGLTLFQTDNFPGLYYNQGASTSPNWLSVGMYHNGNKLFWDKGDVGVGLSSPLVAFHIKDNGAMLRLEGNSGGHAYIEYYANGPSTRSGYIGYSSNGNTTLSIVNSRTNGNISLVTSGTGKVTTNADLTVGDDLIVTDQLNVNDDIIVTDDITANGDINAVGSIKEGGNTLIPTGVIVMWSGSPSAIPAGWGLCDGNGGRPNLKGRFIVGYDAGDANYNAIGDNGGAKTVALTSSQMPSHSHGSGSLSTNSTGAHTHTSSFTSGAGVGSAHRLAEVDNSNGPRTVTTSSSGSHSHTISGSTASIGSGSAHENRPPYYTLAYIIKL